MTRNGLLLTLLSLAALVCAAPGADEPSASKENIAAALKLTLAAATEYEIRVGGEKEPPLDLKKEPVLQWSNPDRGEVHGNVFVWTRDGRPLVVASLFKWFNPHTHMSHEFLSLVEQPLVATFHGKEVWKAGDSGLRFSDVPKAPVPAAADSQRLLQMKQLAKEFTGTKKDREDANAVELRLLPQPVYQYAAPKQEVLSGGLFALVHGTDPEIWLLVEARGKDAANARWRFAVARMSSSELRVRHQDKHVWAADTLAWKDAYDHGRAYTSFLFKEIPDFLKEAVKPKP
jgi:hypothetical protein